jgi:hypothetical protein
MQHKRRAYGAVALVAALAVTAAACGDNDDGTTNAVKTEARAPSVAEVAGSDQHLNNTATELARQERVNAAATARLAGEAERQAYLEGQARTYGDEQRQPSPAYVYGGAVPSPVEAGNRAAAEAAERQAHLDGQANTYGD